MNPDPTPLEQRLRAALTDSAELVPPRQRPVVSWEKPIRPQASVLARRRPRTRAVLPWAVPVAAATVIAGSLAWSAQPGSPGPQLETSGLFVPAGTEPIQPGQLLYTRETIRMQGQDGFFVAEVWRPQHAADEWTLRTTRTDADGDALGSPFISTAACGNFEAGPGMQLVEPRTCDDHGSWDHITPQFLASLPTDPGSLYQRIHDYVVSDYRKSADVRTVDTSEDNVAFLTLNYIADIATDSGGMSEPFSKALERAASLVPGVVVGHATNLVGVGATSYQLTAANGAVAGPIVFDTDGNYVGRPDSDVTVGAADRAGTAPATR
jgi:hypothetical protein